MFVLNEVQNLLSDVTDEKTSSVKSKSAEASALKSIEGEGI